MSQISIHGRFIVIIIVICTINLTKVEGRKCVCTSKDCKEAGEDTCETKYYCYTELILFTDQEFGENTTTRGCTQSPTPLLCETKSWVTRSKLSTSSSSSSKDNDEIVENRHVSSTRLWIRMSWPRLKCCDSQDYCNADHLGDLSTWIREREKEEGKKRKKIKEKGEKVGKEEKFSFGRMNQNNNLTSNAGIDQNDDLQSSNKFNQNNNLISLNSSRSFTNSSSSSQDQIISISSESISTINENLDSNHFLQHRVRPLHVAVFVLAISALISVLAACYVIMRFIRFLFFFSFFCFLFFLSLSPRLLLLLIFYSSREAIATLLFDFLLLYLSFFLFFFSLLFLCFYLLFRCLPRQDSISYVNQYDCIGMRMCHTSRRTCFEIYRFFFAIKSRY
ncbi:uncharacterized protein LOC124954096 isoform X1 [Vespa velutina]|uniref:uncharacterized protein LOC124954096 isoform X1 n=1 Tax=Vespa velutina TaxID=202808 RepID=UPI001FB4EBAA|nr:uncharacterized protein LOC124954096 isoform X1 [Vespa velutina]XP_047362429.1 uncharacterized protein LOC124954096 isoform X1 [Vespa velutina]